MSDTVVLGKPEHPKYWFSLIPRLYSLPIYDEKHPDNYIAQPQIEINGDFGEMFGAEGAGFYRAVQQPGFIRSVYEQAGIGWMEAFVKPSHARLMTYMLRDVAIVEEVRQAIVHGRPMVRVIIRAL